MYRSVLRVWMMDLWRFTREFNNSVPLPSYVCAAFTNPEMTRRIHEERDFAVRVIGHCAEVLVVNKLAADIKSRGVSVTNEQLACISATLGTKSSDILLLLNHTGAIEFTNMIFFILDDFYSFTHETVPSYALDVVRQTSSALSRALPPELNTMMRLSRTDTLMGGSDWTSSLTAESYRGVLRTWMKNLWHCTRGYYEPGKSVPLSSPLWIAFSNPEMTRRIHEGRDLTIRVIGRCVEALLVSKLAVDISSRNISVHDGDPELACLATILGTESHDVMNLLSHPGAIELTMMVFLALDNFYSFTPEKVPPDVLDVVQQTLGILSQALPAEPDATMLLGRSDALMRVPNGTSSLTAEMYRSVFRAWMVNLWDFTREFNELQNSGPLPSYVCAAFTNPEMTRRIREERDLAVRVIGRCVGALVVNKLAADINSRNVQVPVTQVNDELACLSATLGTKSPDVLLLLNHAGAIEFTNMAFLALDDFYSFTLETLPPYVLDVVHRTSSTLFRGPSPELNARMRLNQTDNLVNISDGTSPPTAAIYRSVLRVWMVNLWQFTRDFNERGNSVPLPPYVRIAFTNQEMTRRIREERDPTIRVIGRCVEALVVNKLAADINSRNVPVTDDELACLSTILDSNDVRFCLGRPGTIELVNIASLALGDVSSIRADQMPPDMSSVLQQTLAILSQALPAQGEAEIPLDRTDTLVDFLDDNFERVIVSRLHSLLNICIQPGAPSLTEEVRASCLRMCLKALWHCGKAYHRTPDPLPSYFPLLLAKPEISRHFPTEQDLVARIMGCCFGALIVSKLVDAFKSPIFVSGRVLNEEMACISAILGTEHHGVLLLPHHLHVINFRNVVSLMSGRIKTLFTAGGKPADVALLNIAQETLYTLANSLRDSVFTLGGLRRDQERLLQEISSDVVHLLRSDQRENETVETLERLRQILEELPPEVEQSQDIPTQSLDQ
ncbi:hypothetical protein H4582DRAFT_7863 [Lactarius indigo]|nr:hypothetical protein H4582DRAFT_7863 [Lactarius indigo]